MLATVNLKTSTESCTNKIAFSRSVFIDETSDSLKCHEVRSAAHLEEESQPVQQSTETEINTSDESAEKEVSKLFAISVRKFSQKKNTGLQGDQTS